MPDSLPQLYLLTPALGDVEPVLPGLAAALAAVPIGAVLLRLAEADERTLVNRVKAAAAVAHRHDAALMVALPGEGAAGVAVRGGADGLHVEGAARVAALRAALAPDRSLGVGGLRTRDDAMAAGEAGADYVMLGEPRPDGWVPPLDGTAERSAWWAAIFETPCVAYAADAAAGHELARTGAEFLALGPWAWLAPDGSADGLRALAARLAAEGAPA